MPYVGVPYDGQNREQCGAPHTVSVQYITGFTARRNTVWPGNCAGAWMFLENGGSGYVAEQNVVQSFMPYYGSGAGPWTTLLSEDYNVLCGGWTWVPAHDGPHSVQSCSPAFTDTAHDDYRLTGSVTGGGVTYQAGVTWRPADYRYGP
jgi:hypothetical protein